MKKITLTSTIDNIKKEITLDMIIDTMYDKYNNQIIVYITNDNTDGHYSFVIDCNLEKQSKEWKSFEEEKNACMNKIEEMFQK